MAYTKNGSVPSLKIPRIDQDFHDGHKDSSLASLSFEFVLQGYAFQQRLAFARYILSCFD